MPTFLVFCQTSGGRVDVTGLASNAKRFFGATLHSLGIAEQGATRLRLVLPSASTGDFSIRVRQANADDWFAAREAEARGHAGGMAMLACRCAHVWALDFPDDAPSAVTYTACGIAASLALGPVLPADHSTLFGVRGAIERAERGTT